MSALKKKISEKIGHLRSKTKQIEEELEALEEELLQHYENYNCDITR